MDFTTTNVLSLSAILLSGASAVIGVINHKRIRSTCCGRKAEVSFDIESTTPNPVAQAPP